MLLLKSRNYCLIISREVHAMKCYTIVTGTLTKSVLDSSPCEVLKPRYTLGWKTKPFLSSPAHELKGSSF